MEFELWIGEDAAEEGDGVVSTTAIGSNEVGCAACMVCGMDNDRLATVVDIYDYRLPGRPQLAPAPGFRAKRPTPLLSRETVMVMTLLFLSLLHAVF